MANKGSMLVEEARKHIGKPYDYGGNGPYVFDCSGFVKYVYKHAIGYDMPVRTARTQYGLGKRVNKEAPMAGDLVFFKGTIGNKNDISHVGMFLGQGTSFIQASGERVNISSLDNSYWKSHYYGTRRILDESETFSNSSEVVGYASDSGIDTVTGLAGGLPLSMIDEYAESLQNALDKLAESNNSQCSLIDLTYGGEFKFYMPESFTESLPISWDTNGNIIGRSVPAVGYTSSGPRSIPIEFEMVAGVGEYEGSDHDNVMEKMYGDLNFIRSLVYPDYSSSIVRPPSVVLLSLGFNTKLKGIVNNLNITYHKPTDTKNRSMHITVSFSVSQVSDEPPSRLDILNNTIRSY